MTLRDPVGPPSLRVAHPDYELPETLIATQPAEPRDSARLLVVHPASVDDADQAGPVEHRLVSDLPEYVRAGDLLVVNDTAVLPARLVATRPGGGRIEGLFLGAPRDGEWMVTFRTSRRLRTGTVLTLPAQTGAPVILTLLDRAPSSEASVRAWRATVDPPGDATNLLARVGAVPLPPYIVKARRDRGEADATDADRARYQTIYAQPAGSVAAPTAGLHFTTELLARLGDAGATRASVTLHVGPGTFQPVATETLDAHPMHHEWFEVSAGTVAQLTAPRPQRIIAVGTTSVRAIESLPEPVPPEGYFGETDLLIAPGFSFRFTDAMLTNFHLPRSTLLALVAARIGLSRTLAIYRAAVGEGYRFYSYGDAMLILG